MGTKAKEQKDLLSKRISDLDLKIQGTCLEGQIKMLYDELQKAGILFKPLVYLSDEWGCPQGVPVIGIPFYLADTKLCLLEDRLTGIDTETEEEVMMYLRHEAGHAFNYAHRLYLKPEWRKTFGPISRPYREAYQPVAFSTHFVRHIPGWYAQKHPDEDFAETFAVWLSPGSDWRKIYQDTPALAKLEYVERAVQTYGNKSPEINDQQLDRPLQELTMTLDTWYENNRKLDRVRIRLHHIIDEDLRKLFPENEGHPAAGLLESNSRRLIRDIYNWTGADRHIVHSLLSDLTVRVRSLGLKISPNQSKVQLMKVAIFLTTLVMNFQYKGQFVEE